MMRRCRSPLPLAALATLAGAPTALGATVRAVSMPKSMVAVDLEEGEKATKNATVCFFNSKGKKVDCGKAAKLKGRVLLVKMEGKKSLKKIAKGMTAKIGAKGEGDDSSIAMKGDVEDSTPNDAGDAVPPASSKKAVPFRLALSWDTALVLPATFNQISYLNPGTSSPSTLWKQEKAVKAGMIPPLYYGYSGEIGIPVGLHAINFGFRYQQFQPTIINSDYTPPEPYASTETKASALGFWFDYQYYRNPVTPAFSLNLTGGLDYDSTTVSVSATKLTDGKSDSSPIASATSKLNLLSLRLGARMDYLLFKPVGISAALNLLVPMTAMGQSYSSNFASGEARGLGNPDTDLQNAIGLKKNTFGAELIISAFLAF